MLPTKTCPKCGIEKPTTDFYVTKGKAGHACKPCHGAQSQAAAKRRRAERLADPSLYREVAEKRCPMCKTTKPADEFHKHRGSADGLQNYCKLCTKGRYDPEYATEQQRRYLDVPGNREKHRRSSRAGHLRREFGITLAQYDAMLVAQSGRCALCPTTVLADRWLAVDHCHATGEVRGLLCSVCNTALERFDAHGQGWVDRAVTYLKGPI